MRKKYFFAIDTIDGGGKTKAIEYISRQLKQTLLTCLITHEPQENRPAGRAFYEAIRNPDCKLNMLKKQEFCVLDRLDHIENVIQPALDRGQIVLCDRYMMSTFAYGLPEVSYEELWQAHKKSSVINCLSQTEHSF